MADRKKRVAGRSRLAVPKTLTPDWFGWAGIAAMFLLSVTRLGPPGGDAWQFPLLSLGEWLLVPLGTASLIMGLLSLGPHREKTLLPLWLSAIVPGVLWLAAAALSIGLNNATSAEGDIFLAWAVQLIFPAMAFLPLLAQRTWRNRLMWALACGLCANIALVIWQSYAAGSGADRMALGGFLSSQHDYGLGIGMVLPLLVAWRGGEIRSNRSMAILFCTFLLPALALGACFSLSGLVAAAIGLSIGWASWRSPAWIMGIFVCLILFGYGSTSKARKEADSRHRLVATASQGLDKYDKAFAIFETSPYFGSGPGSFLSGNGNGARAVHSAPDSPTPWYAVLLGGTGLVGLGLWLALLAELAARALGRFGRNSLWAGGVVGAAAALAASGLWTDGMPEGVGSLVGLLLAVSMLEQPDTAPSPRRVARRQEREIAAKVEAVKRETIIRMKSGALIEDEPLMKGKEEGGE